MLLRCPQRYQIPASLAGQRDPNGVEGEGQVLHASSWLLGVKCELSLYQHKRDQFTRTDALAPRIGSRVPPQYLQHGSMQYTVL